MGVVGVALPTSRFRVDTCLRLLTQPPTSRQRKKKKTQCATILESINSSMNLLVDVLKGKEMEISVRETQTEEPNCHQKMCRKRTQQYE